MYFVCVQSHGIHSIIPSNTRPSIDFFFTKTRYPTAAQKDDLVTEIRAQFEGFEAYDRECLGRWFSGQRGLHGNGKMKVEDGEEDKGKRRPHKKIKSDMIRTSGTFPSSS